MLFRNTLQIGTTGMLSAAGIWLAKNSEQTTVVSRNPSAFANTIRAKGLCVKSIACDYTVPHQWKKLLQNHNSSQYDLILIWAHQNSIQYIEDLAKKCSFQNTRFVWIVSSNYDNPAEKQKPPQLAASQILQTVVLGFEIENNKSRWLSHTEISQGTIKAIKNPEQRKYTIGRTSPWSARP